MCNGSMDDPRTKLSKTDIIRVSLARTIQHHDFSHDELKVLKHVVDGLVRGQEIYGKFSADSEHRDMKRELNEEVRDALIYVAMLAI